MTDSSMTPPGLTDAIKAEATAAAERIAIGYDNPTDPVLRKYLEWQRAVRGGDIARLGLEIEVFGAGWHAAIEHRGNADPRLEDVEVDDGWLVETTSECTCGTGGLPGHIPGCGSIPIAPLDEVLQAHAIVNGSGTRTTTIDLVTLVMSHPVTGATWSVGCGSVESAWKRADNEAARGYVIVRVEVTTVTRYETQSTAEVTR